MMPTLVLTKLWINLVATGAAVSAQSVDDRTYKATSQGGVVSNAGGRRRAIIGPGRAATFTFTLLLVPDADRQTLIGWQGQTVQVRDSRGQRYIGTYFEVDSAEYKTIVSKYQISITLNVIDVVEGV